MPPSGGTLIVKEHFLANQLILIDVWCRRVKLNNALTPMTEDESPNERIVCQES
jgi:hypothetical protein